VRRPAARGTLEYLVLKLRDMTVTLDSNWDNKWVVSAC